ncbi:MAG TPA: 50S ribosomal protein L29 [Oligoflexia bacterium]|nr:50S ribosomal protein L29 [Oligoflexia bacterium]HMR25764.1 50S ribosomal protein L29 [Oligoflexia bacterium]
MSAAKKNKDEIQAFKALSVDELSSKVNNLREESFWLKFKNNSGQEISATEIRSTKKSIARALTVLNEKKRTETIEK